MASYLIKEQFLIWPWQHWAQQYPNDIALQYQYEHWTWQRLNKNIQQRVDCYATQGVQNQQGVLLRSKNNLDLVLNYLALIQLGARVLVLNPALPDQYLQQLYRILNLDFYWNGQDDDWECTHLQPLQYWNLTEPVQFDQYQQVDLMRPATMTLTSGSSGLPKAVVHSVYAHLSNAQGLLQLLPYEKTDCWLLSLPLFHVSGQGIIWRWLYRGAGLLLRDLTDLTEALSHCSHASLVPTQLYRFLREEKKVTNLKHVLLGGAEIPVHLTQLAEQQGINCWCGYGMTEMASTITAKRANATLGVGQVLAGREISLQHDEIYLKGDCLALGYWDSQRIIPLVDEFGWFHSKDKGLFTQYELQIIGRMDNQFFSAGEGIQPEDIERILIQHEAIDQVYVIPKQHIEFGHRPIAIIDTHDPHILDTLTEWLVGKMIKFHIPDAYYLLPDSLKYGGIKVSRKVLIEWFNQLD